MPASKPATKPRWATDLTNNDAPSSGQMDTGWTPGQTGVSDYDNFIKYWTYEWVQYLDGRFGTNGGVVQETQTRWQVLMPRGNIETNVTTNSLFTKGAGIQFSGGASVLATPCVLPVRPGDRITAIHLAASGDGSGVITGDLYRAFINAGAWGEASISNVTINNPSGSPAVYTTTLGAPYTVDDDEALFWYITLSAAFNRVTYVGITFDRLAGD